MRADMELHIRHIMLYHFENAKEQLAKVKSKGWESLPHPPFSPTEAHTDYCVNRLTLAHNWLTNTVYDDLDELMAEVKQWIASKNSNFFAHGIDRLPGK
ncbi:hypothetical protein QR680_019363 [Steinernema hermaphroditum]|uniref:Uncharacterized protein n=1 Tax=Steinernema hermaphroditum TaxID=289476 RepID=A0AA39GQ33_9BILA|nr:hypothetical protein QR680_019363 [Steinernema hermaphroditum]